MHTGSLCIHILLIQTYERSHSLCRLLVIVTGNDCLFAEKRNTCIHFQLGWGTGGPNLQPPIPSLCTATPSFQEKIIVAYFPLSPASYPFKNLTSRSCLLLLPVPYSPGPPDCEKKEVLLIRTLQKNIYALFKEGALLKFCINRL